jgi:nucleotide-binding universal stress UspA family protein
MLGAIVMPDGYDPEADARLGLARTLAEVLGDGPAGAVSIRVVRGPAAPALIAAAADADLLVVGNRGHGAFTDMLLGSTSEHCASHASCPVVVVRQRPAEVAGTRAHDPQRQASVD